MTCTSFCPVQKGKLVLRMCYCLCHPLPSLSTFLFDACKSSKTTLKARSSFKMALSGDVNAQESSEVRQMSYSSQTSSPQHLLHDQQQQIHLLEDLVTHFQIQDPPLEPLHWHPVREHHHPLEGLFLPSLVETCILVAGSLQSLCLVICTRPLDEERFSVVEGFPREEFFFLRWKWLFRGMVGEELFFLSVGEL